MCIYIYGPHLISWADILHFWHFLPSFIVKNAPILQPTNCGCKFVFLFSCSSLLLPFSALFLLFSSASINLKASKLPTNWGVRLYIYNIYIYICLQSRAGGRRPMGSQLLTGPQHIARLTPCRRRARRPKAQPRKVGPCEALPVSALQSPLLVGRPRAACAYPKNLFGLIFNLSGYFHFVQGYFWRPSENTL